MKVSTGRGYFIPKKTSFTVLKKCVALSGWFSSLVLAASLKWFCRPYKGQNMGGKSIDLERAPAFRLLFHLGKTTMRPGGIELTRKMLDGLQIGERDRVVEFAPGRGITMRMVLEHSPRSYTGIERDRVSQQKVQEFLHNKKIGNCILGKAQASGLKDGCASVVFGEAMLTMRSRAAKLKIAKEAFRLLEPGGRYGIHESCLTKDDLSEDLKNEIEDELNESLLVRARPLTLMEWRELLEETGFEVRQTREAPMHLLELRRVIQDEGLWGTAKFVSRVIGSSAARRRILNIRYTFSRYGKYIDAITMIAVKPK